MTEKSTARNDEERERPVKALREALESTPEAPGMTRTVLPVTQRMKAAIGGEPRWHHASNAPVLMKKDGSFSLLLFSL